MRSSLLSLLLWALGGASRRPEERWLDPARAGDDAARSNLIAAYKPLVLRVASQVTGRYMHEGQDEEISVGLLAINEAIDRYDSAKGGAFPGFAELVIRRRLVDHLRRKGRHSSEIPMSEFEQEDDEGNTLVQVETRTALDVHQRETEALERRDEIAQYQQRLSEFGIRFAELVEISPRHQDARERAIEAARIVAAEPLLREHLVSKKELPLRVLEQRVDVSRKTLERQRKYIIAVSLVLIENYGHLKQYVVGK